MVIARIEEGESVDSTVGGDGMRWRDVSVERSSKLNELCMNDFLVIGTHDF